MRAVLDTNVLISAFANLDGTPGKIYRAWTEAVFELVISEYILWRETQGDATETDQ